MLHNTKGIVLRTVRYGDTSVIVTIYTEKFGVQSYIVNGVRSAGKKSAGKLMYFQPAAILNLQVYHNHLKNIHRIKEYEWGFIYQNIFSDVSRNAVAVFVIELLQKCLKQPEQHEELFGFIENAFLQLDQSEDTVMANYALYFALQLPVYLGFGIGNRYSAQSCYLDIQEGNFVTEKPSHPYYLEGNQAKLISNLLNVQTTAELANIHASGSVRGILLQVIENFYALHLQDFGKLKTPAVLKEVLR